MTLCIAHRGARSVAPENTLAAARKALALKADLWETDLAVTRDDELILFHDDALTRTTNVDQHYPGRTPGPFSDYTLEEIRALDAGSWFAFADPHNGIKGGEVNPLDLASFKGEKVPTLREALEFTRDAQWRLNLELKRQPKNKRDFPMVERVLKLVDEVGIGPDQLLFSSGEHHWLKEIEKLRPEFEIQALVGLFPHEPLAWHDGAFKTYNVRVTRTTVEEVRAVIHKGHAVNVYVVNEPTDIARWTAAGAAGIITDFPQRMKAT